MSGWENFFIAEVGASAALADLVFVGISINLTRIMSYPGLTGRAGESLIVLDQAAILPIIAGATLLLQAGSGIYWIVPGVIFTFVDAIVNAWVLLIEINR